MTRWQVNWATSPKGFSLSPLDEEAQEQYSCRSIGGKQHETRLPLGKTLQPGQHTMDKIRDAGRAPICLCLLEGIFYPIAHISSDFL